jgi:hypothetical protein
MKIRPIDAARVLCCCAAATAATAAAAAAAAAAGPIAPARYVDAQGVEVIHNRGDAAGLAGEAGAVGSAVGSADTPARADPKLTIQPAQQAQRDADRIAILDQELQAESRAYADLWTRLYGARTAPPGSADAARLNAELAAHQKNIQALNAELHRARATRATRAAGTR